MRHQITLLLVLATVFALVNICPIEAGRALKEEQKPSHVDPFLLLSSLDKDPPSAPNPTQPSWSTINQKGFAGHAMPCRVHNPIKHRFGSA
ncbi:hypothetical protein TIFTF001_018097 [Ficus carica]|uniref:Uncharacterized protein n=1 Tax=Ficus carica TaxID=3494 RepID=A0AA88ADG4_FICCA|nr:hypothetical protein TIFTF001_018097 [Ficus carica]